MESTDKPVPIFIGDKTGVRGLGGLTIGVKVGSYFTIGDEITVIVQRNSTNNQLQMRVIAPKELSIRREGYDAEGS